MAQHKVHFFRWFFFSLSAIILLIGGVVVYYWKNFDLNDYKPWIEKTVYEQTGRTLKIKGSADLELSLIPTLSVKNATLSNPSAWQDKKNMAEVGSIEIKIALLPLFKKKVIIDKIILSDALIRLEKKADGSNNWEFSPVQNKIAYSSGFLIKNAYAGTEADEALLTDILEDIQAKKISVQNSRFQYIVLGNEFLNLQINEVWLSTEGINQPTHLSWDILYNGLNIKGKGDFGSIADMFQKDKAWPINTDIEALNIKAHAKGNLYNLINENLKANIYAEIKNPAGNFNAPKIDLAADIKADLQKADINIKKLNVANNIIRGKVSADISSKIPFIQADLQSDLINVKNLIPPYKTVYKFPSLIASAHANEFVPTIEIPYEYLNIINGRTKIFVQKMIINSDMQISDADLSADLNKGNLQINKLQFNIGKGTITSVAKINSKNQKIELKLNTKDIVLQEINKEFLVSGDKDFGILNGGKSEIYLDLSAYGNTTDKLAKTLNGQTILIVGESEFKGGNLSLLTNDFFQQLTDALNIDVTKNKNAHLNCAVVRADLDNGKMKFPSGIVFDSDNLNIIGDGKIDLNTDKLKLNLNAYRNNVTDISVLQALTNLIKITGKIQNPTISLNKGGTLKTIAGVAAGPAYAGAGMFLEKDTYPCHSALAGTIYQNYFPTPSGVRNTAHKSYKKTEQFVSDSVNMAKDSAKAVGKNVETLFNNLLK